MLETVLVKDSLCASKGGVILSVNSLPTSCTIWDLGNLLDLFEEKFKSYKIVIPLFYISWVGIAQEMLSDKFLELSESRF